MSNNTSKIEVKCSTCNHGLFDDHWGEYKCKKKQRRSTESECKMGCSDWQKLGAKADEPKPEILVRSGATFTPHVSDSGVLSWTNDKGLPNPKSVNVKGEKGEQGEKGEKGADGAVGKDGKNGADGFSPVVAVEDIVGGHRVTITDKDSKKTFDVMDGKDGEGGSGSADWSVNDPDADGYVKNRTHWMERYFEPIVWDGNTEGRDIIDLSPVFGYPAGSVLAYKISDQVLTSELLSKTTVTNTTSDGKVASGTINVDTTYEAYGVYAGACGIFYEYEDGLREDHSSGQIVSTALVGDFTDTLGVIIPSSGTYCIQMYAAPYHIELTADVYHQLDEKYLPDAVATKDYVSKLITGAIGGIY